MAVAMPLRTYRVVLEPEPDGSAWNVSVPALPGCFTYGATVAQALERAQEAIAGYLEALAKHGGPLPPPDADTPAVSVVEPRVTAHEVMAVLRRAGCLTCALKTSGTEPGTDAEDAWGGGHDGGCYAATDVPGGTGAGT